MQYSILNTQRLVELNRRASEDTRLSDDFVSKLEPEGIHFVLLETKISDGELKVLLSCKCIDATMPELVFFDLTVEDWAELDVMIIEGMI